MRRTSTPRALALLCLLLAGCARTSGTRTVEYLPNDAITTTRPLLRITPPAPDQPVLTVHVFQQVERPLYRREDTTRQTYCWSPTDPAVALFTAVFFLPAAVVESDHPQFNGLYEHLPKAALGQEPFNKHRILSTEELQGTGEPTGRTTTVETPLPEAVVEIVLPTGAPRQYVANDQGVLSLDLAALLAGLDVGPGAITLQVSTRQGGHVATETVVLAPEVLQVKPAVRGAPGTFTPTATLAPMKPAHRCPSGTSGQ